MKADVGDTTSGRPLSRLQLARDRLKRSVIGDVDPDGVSKVNSIITHRDRSMAHKIGDGNVVINGAQLRGSDEPCLAELLPSRTERGVLRPGHQRAETDPRSSTVAFENASPIQSANANVLSRGRHSGVLLADNRAFNKSVKFSDFSDDDDIPFSTLPIATHAEQRGLQSRNRLIVDPIGKSVSSTMST